VILGVQVKPNAHATRVMGWADERTLILAVAAPPVEGKANDEVVRFLARTLGLPRTSVTLERGASSRVKHIGLPDGTSLAPLREHPG
jgi:uncharacterized protein (TIGR00251 family)